MTADQLLRMPDDGFRYELVKGNLRKMTPSGFNHGKIVAALTAPVTVYVKANALGVVVGAETGFQVAGGPDTVLAPDMAFVRQERVIELGVTDQFWPGAPDLVAEVLSPSDRSAQAKQKVAAWLGGGVGMVWVVDPTRRVVQVHRSEAPVLILTEKDELDGQDVTPGFKYSVSEVFA